MKTTIRQLSAALIIVVMAFTVIMSASAAEYAAIETDSAESGLITVRYDKSLTDNKAITFIFCNGYLYMYNIVSTETNLPLQMGDGDYGISIHEVSEGQYKTIAKTTVTVSGLRDELVYTNSVQMVDYKNNEDIINEINLLFTNTQNEADKVEILYNYIMLNYRYCEEKAESTKAGYLPDLYGLVNSGKGICYDYASLFAAVLRSNNIPTKLNMGYRNDVEKYHAWNEVMIDGEWLTIDISCDAELFQAGIAVDMVKDSSIFQVIQVY